MLIDDIRSGTVNIGFADRAFSQEWQNADFSGLYDMCADGCAVIRSDNVFRYICDLFGNKNGTSNRALRDVAVNVAPLFSDMWFEFKNLGRTFGVYLRSCDIANVEQETRDRIIQHQMTELDDEPPRWIAMADVFAHRPSDSLAAYAGRVTYLIGASGMLCHKQIVHLATNTYKEDVMYFTVEVVLFTLTFMHCKNVRRVENDPSPALQKARQRKGKPPLVKHYTIEINPMKEILRKEGRIESEGLARALHICRGHFATYSEEKPLFGKVTGTVWIPAHVRGSKDAGEVRKDYKIKL
jgi:hypothetical protein